MVLAFVVKGTALFMENKSYSLGIDLGSISLKVVLLDRNGELHFSRWTRVAGDPFKQLDSILRELSEKFPTAVIEDIGVTGSGRVLVAESLGAKAINEITAHAAAASRFVPQGKTIIEIGGQDSKLMILEEGGKASSVKDFSMNELCAAGTGAFLDQQAARLNLSIERFAELADRSENPVPIAGRCAVFAKTDMTHHQQEGRSLPDIVAGLNEALVRSYLANLVRGKELPRPIVFQGGVASNKGLVNAFKKIIGLGEDDLLIPEHHRIMGAIGAALGVQSSCSNLFRSLDEIYDRFHQQSTDRKRIDLQRRFERLGEPKGEILGVDYSVLDLDGAYLGIDVGSVSVKLVVIAPQGIIFSDYRFSDGRPLETLGQLFAEVGRRHEEVELNGIGVTGSGRHLIGKLLEADAVKNEISAQAIAVNAFFPHIDTIVEIGGQDSKFIRVDGGRASYFAMNKVCAAGTGAFLQEQAHRLDIDLEKEFSLSAFASSNPVPLGARCTVFMESDLVSHQQQGCTRSDLIAGLAKSVVDNYVEKVLAGSALGQNILFLGGVAENRAVHSALELRLKRPVAVSGISKISGALGAAIAAARETNKSAKRKLRSVCSAGNLEMEQFVCDDCPNSCRVTRTREKPVRYFGGICGKWDSTAVIVNKNSVAYVDERARLLEAPQSIPKRKDGEKNIRIGIPRALMAFDQLLLWKTFFEHIDCDVIVSPLSNSQLLKEGMKKLVVETCLPVKAFGAHIEWLNVHGDVDYIFVPSLVNMRKDRHSNETLHCPYIQALGQIAKPLANVPLLNPVISWTWHPEDAMRTMISCAMHLGKAEAFARGAWRCAVNADCEYRLKVKELGSNLLRDLADKKISRAFLLMGKDYNLNDPMLNSDVVALFEKRGEAVVTQDMLVTDDGSYPSEYKEMCWSHGKEILAAAEKCSKTNGLYPVLVTSFGCGPDSFTVKSAKNILGEKPFLILDVDEHSSSVGMETRVEAFIDSLPACEDVRYNDKLQKRSLPSRIERVFLPHFSDHGYAFASAIRSLGLRPVLTDLPDDESARFGAEYATSGECHPFVLMLGDYIKTVKGGTDFEEACYLMPASGICRVGQFARQMGFVSHALGDKLPIISSVGDLSQFISDSSFTARIKSLITYWEMMRGMDFLIQKYLETRAYESTPGSADRAHKKGTEVLMECIMKDHPHEGLRAALDALCNVPVDMSQKRVKIGVTGDYYTRVCDYSNAHIFREIERLGGVVMLSPTMTDFVKYDARRKWKEAINHRKPNDLFGGLIMRSLVDRREKRVRKIFDNKLIYDVPLDYERSVKLVGPYMNIKLPTGLTGSVAAVMEQIEAGADGILSLITFHCNYGLVLNSVLKSIDRDYPHIPKLALIFEGLKPTHNLTRLEAFMERVRSHKETS